MTSPKTIGADISAIRNLYASSPVARAVLDHFAARTNSSSKTTLNRLMATLQSEGHDVVRSDVRQVLRSLESANCGRFVVGRKGHPSRFVWGVSLVDAGRAASGETSSVSALRET